MFILLTLLIICFIVFFHELGHFLVGRACKIKVNEFSIGLGPRLVSIKKGETRYSIKALPLGGACEFAGSLDEGYDEEASEDSFMAKGKLQRAATLFAGPLFNFILAFVLALIIVSIKGYNLPVVSKVQENSAAQKNGIMAGDIIKSMNNEAIHNSAAMSIFMSSYDGKDDILVKLIRNNEKKEILIPAISKNADGRYFLGVIISTDRVRGNVLDTIKNAYYDTEFYIKSTIAGLKMLFTGKAALSDMTGPIGLTNIVGNVVKNKDGKTSANAVFNVLNLTALISANLGILNLLPIPVFDGGRLFLILIEAIRGKRLNPRVEERILVVGFVMLVSLSVFVLFSDILKIFK